MSAPIDTTKYSLQLKLVALAREIAMDMKQLPEILKELSITPEQFLVIKSSTHFKSVLEQEIATWNSALNTQERVKLKSQAMIEMSLEEFYSRMHDSKEPLSAKVELLKTLAKIGGVDTTKQEQTAGERFLVNINLGADHKLTIDKPKVTSQVIEGEVL